MLTILVTNTKGGCGKTTISTNLAGAMACAGFQTALADCDRQQSAHSWVERRPKDCPSIRGFDWSRDEMTIRKGTQRLIIDAPAGLKRKVLEDLVRTADIVVLPVLPSIFDETTTRGFLEVVDELKPVRKGKRAVAVVGNRMRLRTQAVQRLDRFLRAAGHPVVARLRDSQAYVTAAEQGLSIFEMPSSRLRPVLEDWTPLLSFIANLGTSAEAA